MRRNIFLAALVHALLVVSAVQACPICNTATGKQVRAGIFNSDFGPNLVMTLMPFPVLIAIVSLIHFGLPGWVRGAKPETADGTPR